MIYDVTIENFEKKTVTRGRPLVNMVKKKERNNYETATKCNQAPNSSSQNEYESKHATKRDVVVLK